MVKRIKETFQKNRYNWTYVLFAVSLLFQFSSILQYKHTEFLLCVEYIVGTEKSKWRKFCVYPTGDCKWWSEKFINGFMYDKNENNILVLQPEVGLQPLTD